MLASSVRKMLNNYQNIGSCIYRHISSVAKFSKPVDDIDIMTGDSSSS